MPKWSLTLAGECDSDKLEALPQAAADALAGFGLTASHVSSDMHNGPLPAPAAKARRTASKPDA